ncbi:MAG: hypothetical protein RLW62_06620, partial [Gammaproteobacteria bacterium]
ALDTHRHAPRTVVVKLKTSDFRLLTRSHTPPQPPASAAELAAISRQLLERVDLPAATRYRLVGTGLANFATRDARDRQAQLFDAAAGACEGDDSDA